MGNTHKIHKLIKQTIVTHSSIYVADVEIQDNKFCKITRLNESPDFNNILMPGFIDIHTHGGYGFSFNDLSDSKNINSVKKYLNAISKEGVTNVFATTVTCPINDLKKIYSSLLKLKNTDKHKIIYGWHIEGPFISPSKLGAHNSDYIVEMDNKNLSIIKSFNKVNKIITFAPEYKNNQSYIKSLSKFSTISLGHTIASSTQTNLAINDGAKHLTHFMNAMPKFEQRNPTIINEAFENTNCYCELICDLVHIEPLPIKTIYKTIGCNRIILVTDSLSCKGLKNGKYMLGSIPINKHDNIATLSDDKSIAGSIQPYIQQLRNFYNTTNCSLNDLVKISSYNACKSLNLKDVGEIKIGYKANFVLLDNKINLKHTYIGGKKVN
jgi:N-acetylglucosamine-6-phosphate deacetylase